MGAGGIVSGKAQGMEPSPSWLQCNVEGTTQNWQPLPRDKSSPQEGGQAWVQRPLGMCQPASWDRTGA